MSLTSLLPPETRCSICHETLFCVPRDSDARFVKRFWQAKCSGELQECIARVSEGDSWDERTANNRAEGDSNGRAALNDAVTVCQTHSHVMCAEPCAMRFCALNEQPECPLCRKELSAPLALCAALCSAEVHAYRLQKQLGRAREVACAAVERTFSEMSAAMQEHVAREPLWNITPTICNAEADSAAVAHETQPSIHRHSHDVRVTYNRVTRSASRRRTDAHSPAASASNASIAWTRVTPGSAVSSAQTLQGPWPAIMSEDELLALCRQMLGVQLRPLIRGGNEPPLGWSSADLARRRSELQSEIEYATRQVTHDGDQYFDMSAVLDSIIRPGAQEQ